MDQQLPRNQTPIPNDKPIEVVLQAQQWNMVLAALLDAPYRLAAPLIEAIQRQCVASATGLAKATEDVS